MLQNTFLYLKPGLLGVVRRRYTIVTSFTFSSPEGDSLSFAVLILYAIHWKTGKTFQIPLHRFKDDEKRYMSHFADIWLLFLHTIETFSEHSLT